MDALRHVAEQRLQARRGVELLGLARLTKRRVMGLPRPLPCLLSPLPRRLRVIQVDLALRDPRLEIVKLGVQHTHLPQIPPFEGLKLRPHLGKLRLALRKPRANGRKLLALIEKGGGVRSLLEDDLGWHAASP